MRNLVLVMAGTVLGAAPLLAQAPAANTTAGAATTPAAAANVTVGAPVSDPNGGAVGTVESINGANATVSTGTAKAALPLSSFAQGPKGLVIALTKADLEAAVAKASQAVQITAGAAVTGPQGGSIGTVDSISGDLVTVTRPSGKVQLPRAAFAQGAGGTLVIGMTPEQLDAAAKAAQPAG